MAEFHSARPKKSTLGKGGIPCLNLPVQRYTPYKSARRKRQTRRHLVSVLLVLVVATLVWALRSGKQNEIRDLARPPGSLPTGTQAATPGPKSGSKSLARPPAASQVASVTTSGLALSAPSALASQSPVDPSQFPRPAQNVFEAQLALARMGISPGSLDGVAGWRTRQALVAYQQKENLPVTGEPDTSTRGQLLLATPPFTNYTVTGDDLARLRSLGTTWLEKSQQDRLDYETILEMVAERAQSHPHLIQRLNPSVDWSNIVAATSLVIPNAERPAVREKAALARIHLEERILQVFGENTNLLGHFPCSIAAFAEKRPVGELHVATVALNPNYTFDPENFPESTEARQLNRKLILPPGPNNPVGTVWIGLDKPGYGIHGTPRPEQVGRAESHGCFRLANWNAEYFSQLVWVGMPVFVEP